MPEGHPVLSSKFFYLLISLLLYFLTAPLITATGVGNFFLSVTLSLMVLVCINITAKRKYLLISSIFLGLLSLYTFLDMIIFNPSRTSYQLHFAVNALFIALITYATINAVATQKRIMPDTLFGAICGYLLIGLTWTYFYLMLFNNNPNAFTHAFVTNSPRETIQEFIYYSFVTLTSLGYGDMVGNSNIAKTFSWLECVTGQIYLAVWISQLVGLRIVQRYEE